MQSFQNIQIPLSLFNNIITLVDFLKINDYNFPQFLKFDEIHSGLRDKQHGLNKRAAYSDIIYSSGDKRKEAQVNYQKLKHIK